MVQVRSSQPSDEPQQKPIAVVPIAPPPAEQRVRRMADFAPAGERRTRYSLPRALSSASPIGYRTRVPLSRSEAEQALRLLSMSRPTGFAAARPVPERELFEECSLGIMTARQSTNFRGHREVVFGPDGSRRIAQVLAQLQGLDAAVLAGASHTHVVFSRPYRTAFTMLLTLIGHRPVSSLLTVPARLWRKRVRHEDDIPTIGYLQQLHIGILADAMERAAVLASGGSRRAQVHAAPFCGAALPANRAAADALASMCGLSLADRARGWRVALVVQVGEALPHERVDIPPAVCRKIAANQVAFRSERTQPGINPDPKAPAHYQARQDMDVPDALTEMAGRAAYNAFAHWTGCSRDQAKALLLLERIDVLTAGGKQRLREVRETLDETTRRVIGNIPLWADLPAGRAFSRNAQRGKKAFALAGQRIYIGGLSRREVDASGIDWTLALRAFGAAAARSGLVAELMGTVDLPADCDLLAGVCVMAGPVNQNDIGKSFYGQADLLASAFPDRDPISLLVWTLKAKTVADPIGNEEQLLNAQQKGALVDLRPGPHEVVQVEEGGSLRPMRSHESRRNSERAFADVGNFVTAPDGRDIPGNRGEPWPHAQRVLWRE